MRVVSAEIPMSFYNISEALGNNYFYVTYNGSKNKITIPDDFYSSSDLINKINFLLNANTNINYKFDDTNISGNNNATGNFFNLMIINTTDLSLYNPSVFQNYTNTNYTTTKAYVKILIQIVNYDPNNSSNSYIFDFSSDSHGISTNKFNFKYKLGWILGFRSTSPYVINLNLKSKIFSMNEGDNSIFYYGNLTSEELTNLYGPKYLYLAIEEFNKGNQSSFVTPVNKSLLNKNIIARITMNRNGGFDFGSVLPANNFNGLLMSDTRSYTGKIDLMKLNVQLLTENGPVVNLNGIDFSLCLEVTHE
jgi:hypothetical protein